MIFLNRKSKKALNLACLSSAVRRQAKYLNVRLRQILSDYIFLKLFYEVIYSEVSVIDSNIDFSVIYLPKQNIIVIEIIYGIKTKKTD